MWPFTRKPGARSAGGRGRVPHDFEHLPSLAMVPVPSRFSFRDLAGQIVSQAPDKELVCLVEFGWGTSAESAGRDIEDLFEFADEPSLAFLEYANEARFIIRASFMRATSSSVGAQTFGAIRDELRNIAKAQGLKTLAIDRY